MPARKSARRTKTKSFKKCSKRSRNACRKSSRCSFRADRSPKCQPKRSRRKSRRRSAKRAAPRSRKVADSNLGALMTEGELINRVRKSRCSNEFRLGKDCDEGCTYDRRMGCVPTVLLEDKTGRFLADGSRNVAFRSNKKPAFSFKMPVNTDTVCGDYAGAIRFSPVTGKLVLCYGPLIQTLSDGTTQRSERPLISTIVRENIAKNLWMWYQSTGRHVQRKRVEELVAPDGSYYYADIYGLPGASIQLSWQEANWLDNFLRHKFEQWVKVEISKGVTFANDIDQKKKYKLPTGLQDLSEAPSTCPAFLEKQDIVNIDDTLNCFGENETGMLRTLSDKRKDRLTAAQASATDPVRQARLGERLNDFDPFLSGSVNRREILRKRFNVTPEMLYDYGIDIEDFDDDDDVDEIYALYERKRRDTRREEKRRAEASTTRMMSPSFGFKASTAEIPHRKTFEAERDRDFESRQRIFPSKHYERKKKEIEDRLKRQLGANYADDALYSLCYGAAGAPYVPGTANAPRPKWGSYTTYLGQVTNGEDLDKVYNDLKANCKGTGGWSADLATTEDARKVREQYYSFLKILYNAKNRDVRGDAIGRRGKDFNDETMPVNLVPLRGSRAETRMYAQKAQTRGGRYRGSNSSSDDDDDDDSD